MLKFIDLNAQYKKLAVNIEDRIQRVLKHGLYIQGPEVTELENRLANYVGVKHCIGVGNGTDALYLSMRALGIGQGDEVITAANSFIATSST